ncbi:hypothetical protein NPIL_339121, partial [Nephila pilipes]
MMNANYIVAVPMNSMDTDQSDNDTDYAKCARISLLKKKLVCDEVRTTYLKSLILIVERERKFSHSPLRTVQAAEVRDEKHS